MTVKELKEKLNAYPEDALVMVKGYEDGYNDITEVRNLKIKLNFHEHWYEGAHEENAETDAIEAIAFLGSNKNAKD